MRMYTHYLRLDAEGFVVYGYASAEGPSMEGDVVYTTSGIRQFTMELFNGDSSPKYKWENGALRATTLEEQAAYVATFPVSEPDSYERASALEDMLLIVMDSLNAETSAYTFLQYMWRLRKIDGTYLLRQRQKGVITIAQQAEIEGSRQIPI